LKSFFFFFGSMFNEGLVRSPRARSKIQTQCYCNYARTTSNHVLLFWPAGFLTAPCRGAALSRHSPSYLTLPSQAVCRCLSRAFSRTPQDIITTSPMGLRRPRPGNKGKVSIREKVVLTPQTLTDRSPGSRVFPTCPPLMSQRGIAHRYSIIEGGRL
jgi:hypothetical protein